MYRRMCYIYQTGGHTIEKEKMRYKFYTKREGQKRVKEKQNNGDVHAKLSRTASAIDSEEYLLPMARQSFGRN